MAGRFGRPILPISFVEVAHRRTAGDRRTVIMRDAHARRSVAVHINPRKAEPADDARSTRVGAYAVGTVGRSLGSTLTGFFTDSRSGEAISMASSSP